MLIADSVGVNRLSLTELSMTRLLIRRHIESSAIVEGLCFGKYLNTNPITLCASGSDNVIKQDGIV